MSGDTCYSENLIEYARGADLLIHEVLVPNAFLGRIDYLSREQLQQIIDHHVTPEQAGEVFTKVKPKLAVYSHIVSGKGGRDELVEGTRKTYSGPFEIGEDLMSFDIGDEIKIDKSLSSEKHKDRDSW
jgi:ribonuclease Z